MMSKAKINELKEQLNLLNQAYEQGIYLQSPLSPGKDLKDLVKIYNEWNGLCCKKCSRFIENLEKCDFLDEIKEYNYCCLFKPSEKLTKKQILNFWQDHFQRFIREPLENGCIIKNPF